MQINEELRHRIGLALNEATLLGVEFDKEKNLVACSFSVIAMDKYGNIPENNKVWFIFKPIGRFVASYRKGNWDDENAEVEKFEPKRIHDIVDSFNGQAIYGWDFINCGDEDFDKWKDRLSFDYSAEQKTGLTNTIDLFQEYGKKHIDIRIWFDDFDIFTSKYESIGLEELLENGKRGWDAVYANNKKMTNFGIIPVTNENEQKLEDKIKEITGK
jgi:hypothetical protein